MKKFKSFIGIDVSKKTFDICLNVESKISDSKKKVFSNNMKGFDSFFNYLKIHKVELCTTVICMENTGVYHRLLANLLHSKNANIWVESGFQIKWSLGLQRGKNDKIDAERIMIYANRNQDKFKPYRIKDETVQIIGDYLSARDRIIRCIKMIKVPIKEMRAAGLVEQSKLIERCTKQSLTALELERMQIDKKIKETIKMDEELAPKYHFATSVIGVGFVAASYLLYYTNGFTKFKNTKQIASFSGIAPFEYSSGTSIKGRTKVHHMANKKLKTILHMCAITSIRTNPEMRNYFRRKVGEGKNKMTVINAVRNKILSRIYACVKNEREYIQELL